MSTPDPAFDRDEQMLARLAELDLAAVERVHGRLMAAEATAEIADLGRTYQRLARSLRQTLALKAKLKHDRELHRPVGQPPVQAPGHDFDLEGFRIDTRVDALQDAVDRVIVAAHPDAPERQRTCQERLDRELDDWATDELFGLESLDDHVAAACRALDLPADLAARWRELPRYPQDADPATAADADDDPARRSSA